MIYAVHRCLERNTLREVMLVCPADRPPSPRIYIEAKLSYIDKSGNLVRI